MEKSGKAAIIEAFKALAEKASFACVTDFKGMTVEELTKLRVNIHQAGGQYHVIKNTLGRIAVTDTTHDVLKDKFHENTGVALGFEDPVAVAKTLVDFAKGSQLFGVRCASLNGKPMDKTQVEALSKLPGREQLLAQMLGTMNAVPTNFVSLFANILRGLLYALKAIEEQKKEAA
ncbi:MAG: 50S ribosomal protein L10 [Desulfovibrio sp.]|nr:50S ribosomal protein L10 [Desulfovibrio sp.]